MASGSFNIGTSNGYISGAVTWSSTTNVSANTSTVTATMRLSRTNSGYSTYGSGTFYLSINGVQISNSPSFTLTYNSNTLMVTGSTTVTHASDGKKSITISTWGSSDVFSVSTQSGTATLDTIARQSSISSNPDWEAGSDKTITISRQSSDFNHKVDIYIQKADLTYGWIKQVVFSTAQTSLSTAFSTAENTTIFTHLAGRDSANIRMDLQTLSGSTSIGVTSYYGTSFTPIASTISSDTERNVYIDDVITLGLTRYNSGFTHTLVITCGAFSKTITGVTTSTTWTPTSTEKTSLYSETPNTNVVDGNIQVTTYYNGVVVRSSTANDIDFNVKNSNPTFTSSYTYADTNATITAVTGNSLYIVQNKSTVVATITTAQKAVAINGATMVSYSATLSGETVPATYSSTASVTFNFSTITASTNQVLTIKAIDSRGNSTTATKTVLVVPYSPPVISSVAKRTDGFSDASTITCSGTVSSISVAGVNKNAVLTADVTYRWRISGGTYNTSATFGTVTGTIPSYAVPTKSINFLNTSAYDVEISVKDKIATTVVVKVIPVGQPVLMLDSVGKRVGVNKFPSTRDFEVGGGGAIRAKSLYGDYIDDYIIFDHGNGNVTLNSMGGELYLGYRNTTKVRLFQDLYDSTGTKLILDKAGTNLDVTTVNSGTVNAVLNHKSGYHKTQSFSVGTYGDGYLRQWWNHNAKQLNMHGINNSDGASVGDFSILMNGKRVLTTGEDLLRDVETLATLQNAWVNYGTASKARFWRDKLGNVYINGRIKSGTITGGTTLFVLPSTHCPVDDVYIACRGCNIFINQVGNVVIYSATANTDIGIDGIVFRGV